MAANIDRDFCPKNRSAAVVLSGYVHRRLYTTVRHACFLMGDSADRVDLMLDIRSQSVKRTPLSRQFETKIKIACYEYELKYTAAGVRSSSD